MVARTQGLGLRPAAREADSSLWVLMVPEQVEQAEGSMAYTPVSNQGAKRFGPCPGLDISRWLWFLGHT